MAAAWSRLPQTSRSAAVPPPHRFTAQPFRRPDRSFQLDNPPRESSQSSYYPKPVDKPRWTDQERRASSQEIELKVLLGTSIVIGLLIGLIIFQAIVAILFFRLFPGESEPACWTPTEETPGWPRAAILLPLRGADPKLRDTLGSLLELDYPSYQLEIVLDQSTDPAAELVGNWLRQNKIAPGVARQNSYGGQVQVHVDAIRNRRSTCSPQCSAFYEAVSRLDEHVGVVCTIDGDVVAHRSWLRELVAPLSDPQVGLTHGNRWYMPLNLQAGSVVRYLWNAAAIVPMYFLGMPWAGSMGIRRDLLVDSGLLEKWKIAIVPDAPCKSLVQATGKQVRFVPSLMMPNRESCDLAFALDFLKRQMMWTRLYNPNWWAVVTHAVLTSSAMLAAAVFAVTLLCLGHFLSAVLFCGTMAIYILSLAMLLTLMEIHVRRPIRRRELDLAGESDESTTPGLPPAGLICLVPFAIPLTQSVYLVAVVLAHFRKHVSWRGIRYRVNDPWNVEILHDQPFQQTSTENSSL